MANHNGQLKQAVIWLVSLVVLALLAIFVTNQFSYLDLGHLCYIKIHGAVSGSEDTIRQALRSLEKEDQDAYAVVCQYTRTIEEKKFCLAQDPNLNQGGQEGVWREPPCYIKGSKTIYLMTNNIETEDVIHQRAGDIKKYAQLSQRFWQALNQ